MDGLRAKQELQECRQEQKRKRLACSMSSKLNKADGKILEAGWVYGVAAAKRYGRQNEEGRSRY